MASRYRSVFPGIPVAGDHLNMNPVHPGMDAKKRVSRIGPWGDLRSDAGYHISCLEGYTFMKKRDVIVIGIQPWDIRDGSNCKSIATEMARDNRVLYVNPPVDRFNYYRNKTDPRIRTVVLALQGKRPDLEHLSTSLWNLNPTILLESINWLPHKLFKYFNRLNNRRFAKAIAEAVQRLNFEDYIIFNDSAVFHGYHLQEFLSPDSYIYYSHANPMAVPEMSKHGLFMEPELMRKADLVVANSTHLANIARRQNRRTFYVGQGSDISLYNPGAVKIVPEEIARIPHPIIGYVGLLDGRRLDLSSIEYMARARGNWRFVFVGPEDEDFRRSALHDLSNVHLLGPRDPKMLPAYVKHFDVCINPQVSDELANGHYPRKIDEFLAMGKPIVATKTTAMEAFAEHAYLAMTAEEHVFMIEKALLENDQLSSERRKRFAATHTWENCVNKIWTALDCVEKEKSVDRVVAEL